MKKSLFQHKDKVIYTTFSHRLFTINNQYEKPQDIYKEKHQVYKEKTIWENPKTTHRRNSTVRERERERCYMYSRVTTDQTATIVTKEGSRSKVSIKGQSRVTKMRFGNGLLGPKNNSPIGPSENNPITKD